MLSTLLFLILVVNSRYLLNYTLLMFISAALHTGLCMTYIEDTRLLFNSYSSADTLSMTILLISLLIGLWLITLYSDIVLSWGLKLNNEFIALVLLLMVSLSGLVLTNSSLTLFVAVELQSLVLYILFATTVTPTLIQSGSKVSLSYLINAAMATALLLFGISIHSTILILLSLVWKLGVVPVHVWSLPILDNQHSLIASLYLTITKFGTLVVIGLIASNDTVGSELLTYIGLLNLTVGNIWCLLQIRYQRIIVYSSLIQIGYILLVLSSHTSLGIGYFELYGFYTVILLMLWVLPSYSQWNSSRLLPSIQLWTMILVLYTVAGLPFFPLFWTKLDILLSIQSQSLVVALVSTLLSSLIYIRLIKYMSFYRYND